MDPVSLIVYEYKTVKEIVFTTGALVLVSSSRLQQCERLRVVSASNPFFSRSIAAALAGENYELGLILDFL